MKMRAIINIALVALAGLYPVGVYFGLQYIEPRYLVLALLALVFTRLFLSRRVTSTNNAATDRLAFILPVVMVFFAGFVFINNQVTGLLFYPVMMNAGLLAVFAYTLAFPPSMIERLARITNPDLSANGIAYTRKVTIVWCLFFVANGSIATATALAGNMEWWTLYNGCISYLLMGSLFAVEYVVRLRVQKQGV